MSVVTPYLLNLQAISDKLPELAKTAILARKEEILNILRQKQLGIGENSMGQPLSWQDGENSGDGFYTKYTEELANTSNPKNQKRAGSPYTFQWSGSTFASMNIDTATEGSFHIFTQDGKQSLLEDVYGEIFQLTPEHNDFVNNEIILPFLYQYLLNNLMNV